MAVFGLALRAHNPFLGYHGDFDEAAAACFKTAVVFIFLCVLSLASFIVSAVRSKMDSVVVTARGDYQAV